jgi:hypothetical protein
MKLQLARRLGFGLWLGPCGYSPETKASVMEIVKRGMSSLRIADTELSSAGPQDGFLPEFDVAAAPKQLPRRRARGVELPALRQSDRGAAAHPSSSTEYGC